MAEHASEKYPHLKFRDEFWELLNAIRSDVDVGERFPRQFSPEFDSKICHGLREVFEISGLDVKAPGHWQLLLKGMLNAYSDRAARERTRWTRDSEKLFVRRVLNELALSPEKTLNANGESDSIWQSIKNRFSKEYPAGEGSLRSQFLAIMKVFRILKSENSASDEELSLIEEYERRKQPSRKVEL